MLSDSVRRLLDSIRRLGFVSDEELSSYSDELEQIGTDSADDVAQGLVTRSLLTSLQAEYLLGDRGEECVICERYHLVDRLGSGGMADVYKARDTKLDREVAIKILAPHRADQPDAIERFRREADALARLTLPNVVKALDSGDDRGRNYLVMEYIPGKALNQVLRDLGRIAPTIAADYGFQAATAMQNAHLGSMVHRDIKPGNLLLTPEGQIKVLDLGLVRFLEDTLDDQQLTRDDASLGTPDYMPPEQFQSASQADARSDVYSLGCTLYHLISGQVPFPGSSISEKAEAHRHFTAAPLEELFPEIPTGLSIVIDKMMSKRPDDRFQTMKHVALALAPFVAASSTSLPNVKRTVSWNDPITLDTRSRKNRRWNIILSSVLVSLVILLILSNPWDELLQRKVANQIPTEASKRPNRPASEANATRSENIITIPDGVTVARNGQGQFESISEALAEVGAGQKILILDDAVYTESVTISDSDRHLNLTIEGKEGPTIDLPAGSPYVLTIQGVKGVTISNLHFTANNPIGPRTTVITVTGEAEGCVLDNLTIESSLPIVGILVLNCPILNSAAPLRIANCTITTSGYGVVVTGSAARPTSNIMITGNRIFGGTGINVSDRYRRVQLTGNLVRATDVNRTCVVFSKISAQSGDVLLANNSLIGGGSNLQLEDHDGALGRLTKNHVWCRNNVFVGASLADLVLLKVSPDSITPSDNVAPIMKVLRFDHNFRDCAGVGGLAHSNLDPRIDDYPKTHSFQ